MCAGEAPSAERRPDLARALRDVGGDDAVETERRKRECGGCENREHRERETPLGLRGREQILHGRDPRDRWLGIHGPDRLLDCRHQRGRIAVHAHDERLRDVDPHPLSHRDVERIGRTRAPQRALLHVADDADDDVPRPIGLAHLSAYTQALADRVAVAKPTFRERFAEHHGFCRAPGRSCASSTRPCSSGIRIVAELFGRNDIAQRAVRGVRRHLRARLELNAVSVAVPAQWQLAREGGVDDTGNPADGVEQWTRRAPAPRHRIGRYLSPLCSAK